MKELEELERKFFVFSIDLLCIASRDGFFKSLNPRWTEVLGWSNEELMRQPFIDFVHPSDRDSTIEETKKLTQGFFTTTFKNRYRCKDGSYRHLQWAARIVDGFIVASAHDVTNEDFTQLYLNEMQKIAKIGGWRVSASDMIPRWSDATYDLHEVPRGTPVPLVSAINFYEPEARLTIENVMKDGFGSGKPWDVELPFVTAKGRNLWVRSVGQPVVDQGKTTEIYGIFQDITEYKNIQIAKDLQSAQLKATIKNSPGMVYQFLLEPSGKMSFPFMSPQAFEIFEVSAQEIEITPDLLIRMTHPEDQDMLVARIKNSAETLSKFQWQGRFITKTGRTIWARADSTPEKLADGSILWNGILIDISEEHQLQTQLREREKIANHMERLAALGELSAGVGHEINNPLTICNGQVEKIKRRLNELEIHDEKILKSIAKYESATERISHIVKGLRTMARSDSGVMNAIEVGSTISQCLSLVAEIYKQYQVEILYKQPDSKVFICANLPKFQQVLMNLISNAKDALKDSLEKRIEVSLQNFDDEVRVSVKDSGPGVPKEIQSRIFEPFYTTKEVDQGTGIGLSISTSLMKEHGGRIELASSDTGAEFTLVFPKNLPIASVIPAPNPRDVKIEKVQASAPATSNVSLPLSGLRLLIVDDESDLRELLKEYFESLGAIVTEAPNGKHAVLSCQNQSFDALITDLKMPGLDGKGLIRQLAAIKSLPKNVILMTGAVEQPFSSEELRSAEFAKCQVLQKPFEFSIATSMIKNVS